MAINRIKSRIAFAQYCLRKLGDPVVEINVDEAQIDDAIDDALDMFWEYHADGSTQLFLKHQVTQEDLDSGSFQVPDNVLNVIRVLSLGGGGGSPGIAGMENLQYVAYFSDLISRIPTGGMASYAINMSYLNSVTDMFNAEKLIQFNKHQDRLIIQGGTPGLAVGDFVVYEAVVINDPKVHPETWNNWWLKAYTTALIKKQWGVNLGKYRDVTLPSGLTINGEAIRNEGITEVAELEQRLRDEFQEPPDFYIG
ncbi:head-tail adaptor Ad2 [Acidovorax phage ACP17]|uniref:Neck protein n=1 Tax=Acidovorax phage ACP17 TaxID=2010329 RepID=A0A218M2T9_9CAUD|nr:head-tail adaptor Ad2 [Acidovorax phage ACP17]ASD50362.1 neck protein [Acidovorax phage ACP17]